MEYAKSESQPGLAADLGATRSELARDAILFFDLPAGQ